MQEIKIKNCKGDKFLQELLKEKGVYIPADCGGMGTCGKCRVRISKNAPAPTKRERQVIGKGKLHQGWRLACQCCPTGNITVDLSTAKEEYISVPDTPGLLADFGDIPGLIPKIKPQQTAICVDIGTTTIAAAKVDAKTGRVLGTASCVNRQRSYGADVISRIHAANRGKGMKLQLSVQDDVDMLSEKLSGGEKPDKLIISCNTVMAHLLRGLSCKTLGTAPYRPVDISLKETGRRVILPGVSAFIGGDIVSGICSLDMDRSEEITAMIDLGTNGEMVIGNQDKILAASTAAGPAFEGVNISCGTAGIAGAVSGLVLNGDLVESLLTIEDEPPIGICGSGVVEITAELLKNGIVDETGLMREPYFEEGFPLAEEVRFTQKDIREVQKAKAAIRAGLETLLEAYGITAGQISRLYLAGGFGQQIDVEKACAIGMLPPELAGKTKAVGNASLTGAVRYAAEPEMKARMIRAAKQIKEVQLSDSETFGRLYVEYMNF